MMKDLPFTVSPSAAAYIEEALRLAKAEPEFAGLVPAFCFHSSATAWTPDGRSIDFLPRGHIGWYKPGDVADWDRCRVAGVDFAIHSELLEELRGTSLEVGEAEIDWPASQGLVARRY